MAFDLESTIELVEGCRKHSNLMPVVERLVCTQGADVWIRERNYSDCIRENGFWLNGHPMSTTKLKKALQWLVSHGYVKRYRCDVSEDGVRRLVQEGERRDYYESQHEHWCYRVTPKFEHSFNLARPRARLTSLELVG